MDKEFDENFGQISRFYQTELLSSEECGAFITNKEIFQISKDMGFDITLTTNEFILAELFKRASDSNRIIELNEMLSKVFESRLEFYRGTKVLYPNANDAIDTWIEKCEKTINKIKTYGVNHG